MPCKRTDLPGGGFVIACTRGQRSKPCVACGRPALLLCDGPPPEGVAWKTCSAPICAGCAQHVGPDRDLCPAHRTPTTAPGEV